MSPGWSVLSANETAMNLRVQYRKLGHVSHFPLRDETEDRDSALYSQQAPMFGEDAVSKN
jgi:hypothetical protein